MEGALGRGGASGKARSILDGIDLSRLAGLYPSDWLAVGVGYAREEIKAALFARGVTLGTESIVSPPDLAARLAAGDGEHKARLLDGLARQEVLRRLMTVPEIAALVPGLAARRRDRGFFRKLDRALQALRMVSAHEHEAAVMDSVLEQKGHPSPDRAELRKLGAAYEAFLGAQGLTDPPLAFANAARRLGDLRGGRPPLPQTIHVLTAQKPESREAAFWDRLGQLCEVRFHGPESGPDLSGAVGPGHVAWERWHTLDDGAESVADRLLQGGDLSGECVLIPDDPSVRRSLARALGGRGLEMADPRDPTQMLSAEEIKRSLSPLEVVAGEFERASVVTWLLSRGPGVPDRFPHARWAAEIEARGARQGIADYPEPVAQLLERLRGKILGRGAVPGTRRVLPKKVAEAHLELLSAGDDPKVSTIFEALWERYIGDLASAGLDGTRLPLAVILERLRDRIGDSAPPVDRARPRDGVRLYRLSQAPLDAEVKRVWIVGAPPDWHEGESGSSLGLTGREREVLAGEFALRSSQQSADERLAILREWLRVARTVVFVDSQHCWNGRESESLAPFLRALMPSLSVTVEERGAHDRWRPSYGADRPVPPQSVRLTRGSSLGDSAVATLSVSGLDAYSRCAFLGLVRARWKLRDEREAGADLWGEARGSILHHAARLVIQSWNAGEKRFELSAGDAIERAWAEEPPRGLVRSARLERAAKAKLVAVLQMFKAKELAYREKCGAETAYVEEPDLCLKTTEGEILGRPDRVDRIGDSWFLIDYKSSAAGLPKGQETFESGRGLQLPAYALALRETLGGEVIGAQFVELSKAASRSTGVFFKPHNGKDPSQPTSLRANSKSLIDARAEDAWVRMREHVERETRSYFTGEFSPVPKDAKDCDRCSAYDLCGRSRRVDADEVGAP